MKKILITICLLCFMWTVTTAQNTEQPPQTKPATESKGVSPAIWIGLGVVLFVVILAARRRTNK
ncbi:MAG: hypothetical protein K0Q66_2143 [Chitinophagaceae bacterium]|nr:hypothetical protein [Chitinophagaceae bacterium]